MFNTGTRCPSLPIMKHYYLVGSCVFQDDNAPMYTPQGSPNSLTGMKMMWFICCDLHSHQTSTQWSTYGRFRLAGKTALLTTIIRTLRNTIWKTAAPSLQLSTKELKNHCYNKKLLQLTSCFVSNLEKWYTISKISATSQNCLGLFTPLISGTWTRLSIKTWQSCLWPFELW